jgi:putative endonuclease
MTNSEKGSFGEDVAFQYLLDQGYQSLARNYRFKRFEIDLIFTDGHSLIVVEVKSRKLNYVQHPKSAIHKTKQRQIIIAANAFINERKLTMPVRFDIIYIFLQGSDPVIEHIPNAFYPLL